MITNLERRELTGIEHQLVREGRQAMVTVIFRRPPAATRPAHDRAMPLCGGRPAGEPLATVVITPAKAASVASGVRCAKPAACYCGCGASLESRIADKISARNHPRPRRN
jgi:hypothetical protein